MNWGFVLQQDSAHPRVARVTHNELRVRNIDSLPTPAISPDLSPAEHVWDKLWSKPQQWPLSPQTVQDLLQAVVQEWQNIPRESPRHIIWSKRCRCQAMISACGRTRYLSKLVSRTKLPTSVSVPLTPPLPLISLISVLLLDFFIPVLTSVS